MSTESTSYAFLAPVFFGAAGAFFAFAEAAGADFLAAATGLAFFAFSWAVALTTFFAGLSALAFLTGLSALTGFVFLLATPAAGFLAFFGDPCLAAVVGFLAAVAGRFAGAAGLFDCFFATVVFVFAAGALGFLSFFLACSTAAAPRRKLPEAPEPFDCFRLSFLTPLRRAIFRCWLTTCSSVPTLKFFRMYLRIACRDEPPLSFSVVSARRTISLYLG